MESGDDRPSPSGSSTEVQPGQLLCDMAQNISQIMARLQFVGAADVSTPSVYGSSNAEVGTNTDKWEGNRHTRDSPQGLGITNTGSVYQTPCWHQRCLLFGTSPLETSREAQTRNALSSDSMNWKEICAKETQSVEAFKDVCESKQSAGIKEVAHQNNLEELKERELVRKESISTHRTPALFRASKNCRNWEHTSGHHKADEADVACRSDNANDQYSLPFDRFSCRVAEVDEEGLMPETPETVMQSSDRMYRGDVPDTVRTAAPHEHKHMKHTWLSVPRLRQSRSHTYVFSGHSPYVGLIGIGKAVGSSPTRHRSRIK